MHEWYSKLPQHIRMLLLKEFQNICSNPEYNFEVEYIRWRCKFSKKKIKEIEALIME